VQALFAALNLWLGLQFYLWVRFYERGGMGLQVPRPTGVEGWLPIAGLMNFKYLLVTGHVPSIHPAAMFLFIAFLLMSLVAKKSFCSWLCPVGAFSERLWKLGRKIFRRNLRLPRWLDLPLRSLKYLLLGFFAVIIGSMSAAVLGAFMRTPYGLIADVKMLNFFRDMSQTAVLVLAVLVLLSILIENFWCRYLCPYGALMGLVSLLSPLKIRRNPAACMACIAACSAEGALQFALPPARTPFAVLPHYRRAVPPLVLAGLLAAIFFGIIVYARASNHWQSNLPNAVYLRLVPNASQATHPGF
jgi:polyferredoxin